MNAVTQNNSLFTLEDPTLKKAFFASGLFHVLVFVFAAMGIPFIAKDPPLITTPVSIELVDISDITQTNRRAPPRKEEKPVEIEKPEPPKANPTPKMTAEPQPSFLDPVPIEKPEPVEPAPPEPIQEVAKSEEPKPKPKPKPKEPEKPKVDEQKAFDSLLKNLAPDAGKVKEEETPSENEAPAPDGQIARLSDQLSISELDAFKHQLEPCWNIPAGAKFAENLAVEIRVTMNRDMTVDNAIILDKSRYNRDPAFRAAADSAMRALRNPRCSPFKLPPDKYNEWKSIVINFDPRGML